MAFEVPAGDRREPSAAERFARRGSFTEEHADPALEEETPEPRMVPLKAVLDAASILLVVAGLSVGVVAAWLAGGRDAALGALAVALIVLGTLLGIG